MTIEQAVPIRSTIPARLDRLRWSPFRTRSASAGGLIGLAFGVKAEGKSLETVTKPLRQRQLEFRKECRWLTRS
jgi:hypothetical protein